MRIQRSCGAAAIAVTAAAVLSSCVSTPGDHLGLQPAALERESFAIADVVSGAGRAYVFCPYGSREDAARLGFDPDDVPSIDDNYRAWETASGIGVIFADGREPAIEWFDPLKVDACAPPVDSGEPLDPFAVVRVEREMREFADGREAEIAVLRYM